MRAVELRYESAYDFNYTTYLTSPVSDQYDMLVHFLNHRYMYTVYRGVQRSMSE